MTVSFVRRLLAAVLLVAFGASLLGGGAGAAIATPTPDPHHAAPPTPSKPTNPCDLAAASTPADHGVMAATPATSSASEDFDLLFIDLMIPHHESAIAMAKIALVRGDHPEIRDLAQNIIVSQQAEIDQMRAWRDAWYPGAATLPADQMNQTMNGMIKVMAGMMGTPSAGMGSMSGMGAMMDPAAQQRALCSPVGSFDETFMQLMIPHHQSAVAMAEVAQQQATHPEIRTLAQAIIAAQQKEIAQMKGWLSSWYGATPQAS